MPARGTDSDLLAAFEQDGFAIGLPVYPPDEIATIREGLVRIWGDVQALLAEGSGPRHFQDRPDHPLMAWARPIAREPRLLRHVLQLIGPDALVRNVDLFVKQPRARRQTIQWHVDTAAPWPESRRMLVAWLALTEITPVDSPLEYLPGSHLREWPSVKDRESLSIPLPERLRIRRGAVARAAMPAGHAALHAFRTLHRSMPNRGRGTRAALAIRYLSPRVPPEIAEAGAGFPVSGDCAAGPYQLRETFPLRIQLVGPRTGWVG